jgi:hypothetical protein
MFCLDLQVHVKGYVHITIDNSLSVRKGGGGMQNLLQGVAKFGALPVATENERLGAGR